MIQFEKQEDNRRILLAFWPKDGLSMANLEELRAMVAEFAEVPSESIIIRYNRQKPEDIKPKATSNQIVAAVLKYFAERIRS